MKEVIYDPATGEIHSIRTCSEPISSLTLEQRRLGLKSLFAEQVSFNARRVIMTQSGPLFFTQDQRFVSIPHVLLPDRFDAIHILFDSFGLGDALRALPVIQHYAQRFEQPLYVNPPKPLESLFKAQPHIDGLVHESEAAIPVIIDWRNPNPLSEFRSAKKRLDKHQGEILAYALGIADEDIDYRIRLLVNAEKQPQRRIGLYPTASRKYKSLAEPKQLASRLESYFDMPCDIIKPHKSIQSLIETLLSYELIITADTLVGHLCEGLDVPAYVLCGPTDASIYESISSSVTFVQAKCPHGKPCYEKLCKPADTFQPCLSNLAPSDLFDEAHPLRKRNTNRVLICRIRGLGDIVMCIPALDALSQTYRVLFVGGPGSKLLLQPLDIEVIETEYRHHASASPQPPLPPIALDLIEAHNCTGVNLINRVDFDREKTPKFARADLFADCIAKDLGIDLSIDPDYIMPPLDIKPKRYKSERPVIGFQVDANGVTRIYPIQRWIELALRLPDCEFHAFSSRRYDFPELGKNPIHNHTGKTSLKDYLRWIKRCDIFICTDSFPMHVAPRLGTPLILLAGSTNPDLHLKYQNRRNITIIKRRPELDCMPCSDWLVHNDCYGKSSRLCLQGITIKQIVDAMLRLLGWES